MTPDGEFDFVIVGAGTAGCVLANRLSDDPSTRVCLVESGPRDTSPLFHIPAAVGALVFSRKYGWGYHTVPQPNLNGRTIMVPRGRVLGGCSSTNGMVYFRGHPRDFDDWAAEGNPGWGFRDVLPYFIRSENNQTFRDSPWHGTAGPMYIADIPRPNPLNYVFMDAVTGLGYPRREDFCGGPDTEGFNLRQATIYKGRRVSGVTAFLDPVRHRQNLEIITDAHVNRVLVENRRATGVEIERGGTARRIAARREVILSAGTFGSAQLLLLSGIGDGAELNALGIPVRHALPAVGRNFHDHLAIGILLNSSSTASYGLSWRALPRDILELFKYLLFRRGPLGSNLFETTGFVRTVPGLDRPDVQFVFQPARRNAKPFPIPLGHGFAMNPVLLYPKSRGRVALASADPRAMPLIDPNLLGEESDIDPLVRSIRISRKIFAAPAFVPHGPQEYAPGLAVQDEAGLREYVRANAATVHHPVGTCRMGVDGNAVVDPALRVHGMEGLRVADASVFPKLVGGNTNAAVVMIAEKAADMILGRTAPAPIDPWQS